MRAVDPVIIRRFEELLENAKKIWSEKKFAFQGESGEQYFTVNEPATHAWATSSLSLVGRVFGEGSVHYKHLERLFEEFSGYESGIAKLTSVFQAAKEDYEGGYLFTIRGLIKAEASHDMLTQAENLEGAGYKDPACVVAGVALELALRELANRHDLPDGKADRLNAELCRVGAYNVAKQKQVTAWLDLRNRAAHGDWASYGAPEVKDMIAGVERFVGDHL